MEAVSIEVIAAGLTLAGLMVGVGKFLAAKYSQLRDKFEALEDELRQPIEDNRGEMIEIKTRLVALERERGKDSGVLRAVEQQLTRLCSDMKHVTKALDKLTNGA